MEGISEDIIRDGELLVKGANAAEEGITISTMTEEDRPLIFVNKGFERLTGYKRNEVLGKNCRFLQGHGTSPEAVTRLREAVNNEEACTVELLNYKKDGTPFWNRLSITPIRDNDQTVTHYVGIQSDISDLKDTKARLEMANEELQQFQDRIVKDLEQAKTVQKFLLPSVLPETASVKFHSLFVPMDELGGDFFDVIRLSESQYGILIADVTGHGIAAALLTFMSSTTFRNASAGIYSSAETINLTNQRLYQRMPGDAFVTMFYAIYDTETKKLTYTQAGHPQAYVIRKNTKEVIPLHTGGTIIGIFSKNEVEFTEKEIQLIPGDKLLFYTDAITDTIEKSFTKEVDKTFQNFLTENAACDLEVLFEEIYTFGLICCHRAKYPDDFTLLGMEVAD
jgi:PAS domain S-box-containing protein